MELHVDSNKCTRCGFCASECVSGAIGINEQGPYKAHDYCIRCGHCVAVCPHAALDNSNCPLEKQTPVMPEASSQQIAGQTS